jgi:nicotinamidase-related amidase
MEKNNSSDAVIVIDMLKDFVYGPLKNERALGIIPKIQRLLDSARMYNIHVIYGNDAHLAVDPELARWGPHAMKGTQGAEVIDELKPTDKDYVVEKRSYSAFYETGLDPLLRSLGVNRVIITGQHTHICDRHTAGDAFQRGYKIMAVSDATEAFNDKQHLDGLEYIKDIYNAEIRTVDGVIEEWKRDRI